MRQWANEWPGFHKALVWHAEADTSGRHVVCVHTRSRTQWSDKGRQWHCSMVQVWVKCNRTALHTIAHALESL